MKSFLKAFIMIISLTSLSSIWAASESENAIFFQVIQNQMQFDKTTVESATLSEPSFSQNSYGLNIKLKADAGNQLSAMTEAGIGKQTNIVLNGRIIASAKIISQLANNFLVTGLTKKEARQFIISLH